jgi:hypothetical protein
MNSIFSPSNCNPAASGWALDGLADSDLWGFVRLRPQLPPAARRTLCCRGYWGGGLLVFRRARLWGSPGPQRREYTECLRLPQGFQFGNLYTARLAQSVFRHPDHPRHESPLPHRPWHSQQIPDEISGATHLNCPGHSRAAAALLSDAG